MNPIARLLLGLSTVALAAAGDATPSVPGDWPMPGVTADHQGYQAGIIGTAAPRLEWTQALQVEAGAFRYKGSVIIGDRAVSTLDTDDTGSTRIICWDLAGGSPLWSTPQARGQLSGPVSDGATVFVKWVDLFSGRMLAIDLASGAPRWAISHDETDEPGEPAIVADGHCWAEAGWNHELRGYDTANGSPLFVRQIGESTAWSPAYVPGHLYTFVDSTVRDHDSLTGAILRAGTVAPAGSASTPVVAGSAVLVLAERDSRIVCVDRATLAERWSVAVDDGTRFQLPAVRDGTVYACEWRTMLVLDLASGAVVARLPIPGATAQPILTDDAIVVTSDGARRTWILDRATGAPRASLSGGGRVALGRDRIVVGDGDLLRCYRIGVPENHAPVAYPEALVATSGTPLAIHLRAEDADGDPLGYRVTVPSYGTLSGTAPDLVYTAGPDYVGADAIPFTVSDDHGGSASATVSIEVKPRRAYTPPLPHEETLTVISGQPKAFTLQAYDADGDALTFTVTAQPSHGILAGTPPDLVYTADPGYVGLDDLFFTVFDGHDHTGEARILFEVSAPEAKTATLSLSVDNASAAIYVNGAAVAPGPNANNWTVADSYRIDGRLRTLAVAATNAEPGTDAAGLIARIVNTDGTVTISDGSWKAYTSFTGQPPEDDRDGHHWYEIDYDDSAWNDAFDGGGYGIAPWGTQAGLASVAGAHWIWLGDLRHGVTPVFFRKEVTPRHARIHVTSDNAIAQIFINGRPEAPGRNATDWARADHYLVTGPVESLAVRAENLAPGTNPAGFIARIEQLDGTNAGSDASWRIAYRPDGTPPPDDRLGRPWYHRDYDDSGLGWTAASEIGVLGVAPWGVGRDLAILVGGRWIWTGDAMRGPSPVFIRKSWNPVRDSVLRLSADNVCAEIYLNGSPVVPGPHAADWTVADTYGLHGRIDAVAVRAENGMPGTNPAGLIARIDEADGDVIVSDGIWRTYYSPTHEAPPRDAQGRAWYDPRYDDSRWQRAIPLGRYSEKVWGAQPGLRGLEDAWWIWSGAGFGISPVYFRFTLLPTYGQRGCGQVPWRRDLAEAEAPRG